MFFSTYDKEEKRVERARKQVLRDFALQYGEIQKSELSESEKQARIDDLIKRTNDTDEILTKTKNLSELSSEDKEALGIKEENEYNIYIDTEVVSTKNFKTVYENDKSLGEGQEKVKQQGSNGQVVKSYKVVQKNGIIVSRDLISQDTYNALDKIILRNKSKMDN